MGDDDLPAAIDAGYLTNALRQGGVLAGRVCEVAVESSRKTLLSRIIRLRLAWEGAPDAPRALIFKSAPADRPGGLADAGRSEVEFYTRVAAAMPQRLVPRCFDAVWQADTKAWHLLLEDLTDTHAAATAWPLPPTLDECERIVAALARFHAAWWDDPRLGVSVGHWADADAIKQHLRRSAEKFQTFADKLGDRLSPERRALYEQFFAKAPRLFARYHSRSNLSIVHGDAHVWNCFLPKDGGDDVRLFDWDSWRIGVASSDLSYMMAVHWYPERRRRTERPLLDRYHAALVAHGVHGYDRRALDEDYRASVLRQLMTPVWQAAIDLPPVIWWGHVERICLAIDDLGCREFLS